MSGHEMVGKYRAFLFIDVNPGKEREVLDKLMKHDEVIETHIVPGQYDVLAVLEFELYGFGIFSTAQNLVTNFVIEKVRKLKDVKDTNTVFPTLSLVKR